MYLLTGPPLICPTLETEQPTSPASAQLGSAISIAERFPQLDKPPRRAGFGQEIPSAAAIGYRGRDRPCNQNCRARFHMKTLPKEGEPTRARPAPARSPARTGDMSASVVTEIGSLRRRLTAAHEAERAASVLLAERLSDGKRPARVGGAAGKHRGADAHGRLW